MAQTSSIAKINTNDGHVLAYSRVEGQSPKPTVLFLGGFMSDMNGTKAQALHQWAQTNNRSFIRFDYVGHGASSGKFTDGTIGLWLANVLTIFDQLTAGPVIVVGSSMGGWLMLLLALQRSERVQALVGIASAPDFTELLMWDLMDEPIKQELTSKGIYTLKSEYGESPYPISWKLIEEGRNHVLLHKPIALQCPVRLIHGMKDNDVPYQLSLQLSHDLESTDVRTILCKQGDHRMSSAEDIQLLIETIESL